MGAVASVVNAVAAPIVAPIREVTGAIAGAAESLIGGAAHAAETVVNKAADIVDSTVQNALKNPVQTAVEIALVASGNPELVKIVNPAIAIAQGADPTKVAAASLAGLAGSELGSSIAKDIVDQGGSKLEGIIAGSSAAGATRSALLGQDPLQGALASGINTAANTGLSELTDIQNLPKFNVAAGLLGPTTTTTPQATRSSVGALPSGTSRGTSRGFSAGPSSASSMANIPPEILAYLQSVRSQGSSFGMPQIGIPNVLPFETTSSGMMEGAQDAQEGSLRSMYASQNPQAPYGGMQPPIQMGQEGQQDQPSMLENPVNKLAQLFGSLTPEMKNVLVKNGDVHPDIVQASKKPSTTDQTQNYGTMMMASGGSTSWLDALNYKSIAPDAERVLKAAPTVDQASRIKALKQLRQSLAMSSPFGGSDGMAKGGLPSKYREAAPEGHHPEFVTGLTGYYAGGRGTGQSDDIPAMLHDGDYVMDAEAVSAFGDGSSKAGNDVLMHFMHQIPHRKTVGSGNPVPAKIADGEVVFPEPFVTALGKGDNKRGARMLDEMRHRLREHKRSAPNNKIPPKAKSPLEYLKGVKG